jgi:hypothetical protein
LGITQFHYGVAEKRRHGFLDDILVQDRHVFRIWLHKGIILRSFQDCCHKQWKVGFRGCDKVGFDISKDKCD